jgi:hypothetical protein
MLPSELNLDFIWPKLWTVASLLLSETCSYPNPSADHRIRQAPNSALHLMRIFRVCLFVCT